MWAICFSQKCNTFHKTVRHACQWEHSLWVMARQRSHTTSFKVKDSMRWLQQRKWQRWSQIWPWICRNGLLNAKSQGLFFKKDAILTLKKPTVFPTFFGGLAENSWLSYTKTNSPPPVAIKKGAETGINVLIWEPSVSLQWFIPLLVLTLPIPITHHSSTEECHNYILETQTGPPSNSFSKPSIFNWITVVFI